MQVRCWTATENSIFTTETQRTRRTTTANSRRSRREEHSWLLSFKDAMQTVGAEYGAGRMPALPAFTNSGTLRNGCEGLAGLEKARVATYYIKDFRCQNPEELVDC
jgi:hypothetical protein